MKDYGISSIPEPKLYLSRCKNDVIVKCQYSLSLYLFERQKLVIETVAFTTNHLLCVCEKEGV